uniref:Uncharacterized protein n=1 Tax=Phasianus colchicus TaxID=9054 RepID=A0A669P9T8_PHACC
LVFIGPELTNVCLWYSTADLKGRPNGPGWNKLLHQIAPKIKPQIIEEQMATASYWPQDHRTDFFRVVFSKPAMRKTDYDFFLEETEIFGKVSNN